MSSEANDHGINEEAEAFLFSFVTISAGRRGFVIVES